MSELESRHTRAAAKRLMADIAFSVIRVPFLILFLWLLLVIFGLLIVVLQPLTDRIDSNGLLIAVDVMLRAITAFAAGLFVGHHYRHWNVYLAAVLMMIPVGQVSGPEVGLGILIGYGLADRFFGSS